MRILVLVFILLTVAGPAAAREKTFGAESFMLDNGMQVVVIPNHRAPVVTQMVWYKTGAADEDRGQSGIAHFVEHLMFKGTDSVPPGEFSKRVKAMGGEDNAFTSYDFTAYHQSVSTANLETVMTMEADRMQNLSFPQADVDSERLVVIEERRERTENDPRTAFGEQMRAALFVNHPYGNPVIGWFHEVDALNRHDVKQFYDTWYAPNNAILVVSGDITAKELKPVAERTYGKVPRRDVPQRHWTAVPPLRGTPLLTLRDKSIRQPSLTRLCRAPSYVQDRQASLALQVLENILDGGASTRLYKTLAVEKKIATSIGLSYDADRYSDGTISIGAVPAPGVSLPDLDRAIGEQLHILARDGVEKQELRDAKTRLKDAAIYARDSLMGPAMTFGAALAVGETVDDVEYWPDAIETVTAAQVQDAAQRFLDMADTGTSPCVTGYLLPPEEEKTP